MRRRAFLGMSAGLMGSLGYGAQAHSTTSRTPGSADVRKLFPRANHETFLNAAGGTPLSAFAETGLRKYEELWRLGPGEGRSDYLQSVLTGVRSLFADLIGAGTDEIGLVHCTKAGEQIVLDGLAPLRGNGNIVTNDLHFSGSLHNLIGLKRAGMDVRIVRSHNWRTDAGEMIRAVDEKTALVSVSLLSNINGHVEPIVELSEAAHDRGAFLYADIIQAAGIHPIDVRQMGIDFAACSGYKWLYGPHGVGFFFVRRELQGKALEDRLFPGHVRHNYTPWVARPVPEEDPFAYSAPEDAARYQPGHMSYLGYAALYESLRFLSEVGVEAAGSHSARLNKALAEDIDLSRYPSISPDNSPILTLLVDNTEKFRERLSRERIVASLAGNRLRISPALYNDREDMARLAQVLNSS